MTLIKNLMSSALLCLSMEAIAQNNSQQYTPLPLDPQLRYGILDNGLTYYIRHNETTKDRACFYIVQNVGAILEEDTQNGLAHFLEHMAFQGTKNLPDKTIINYLETVGVKFGANINAYTSLDETVYNLDAVPTYREGIIDTALLVLHDWSSYLTLDDKEIDKERGVIREEWRTRNTANRRMWKASLPILFKNSQYAKRDVIGDTAIINNFKYDTLRAYYHKWYRPDLQAIIIVGDINVDSIENKIKTSFKDIQKRINPAKRIIYPIEDNKEPIVAILTDPEAKTTQFDIDYRHNPLPDRIKASEMGYYISTIQNLAINMINDRLDECVEEPQSPFASSGVQYGELVKSKDAFSLYIVPAEGKEKEAFDRMLLEAEKLRRYGFLQTELDRAKADMISGMEKAYNERNTNKNKAYVEEYKRNFLDFEPTPGIEWEFNAVKKMLPHITLDDVNKMMQKNFFGDENITIEILGQEKLKSIFNAEQVTRDIKAMSGLSVEAYKDNTPVKPLISKKIKAGKIKKRNKNEVLNYTEWQLSNGMKVILKPTEFKKDEILLYAYANGGYSLIENTNQLPSAELACSIINNNGIGDFNSTELRKVMAGKMATLSPKIRAYDHSLTGSSSIKDFKTLLQLFYLHFTGIRKDDDGYNTIMNQYRTALINRSADPRSTFSDSINAIANGHNIRLIPLDTTELKKVNQDEAISIFKELFHNPGDFTVILTGNIDENTMKKDILTYLGGITTGNNNKSKWIDRGIRTPQGQIKCDFTKDLQINKTSNFIYYSANIEPTLENKLTMRVIKGILSNRYLESLRESEGGTYGVSTYVGISNKPVNEAYIEMTFDTDPKMESKLLPMIQNEIDTIIAKGPLSEDLQKTKEILVKNHKEKVQENNYWQNIITNYTRDGINNETNYEKIVNSITPDKVVSMLKLIMNSNNRIEVVMSPK